MAAAPTSTFPQNCVVLIESPDPTNPGYYLQGSGVVIGPHTILTASHVVYDIAEQAATRNTQLYPGWSGANPALGAGYISTTYTDHFNQIGVYGSTDLTKAQSALDYAVINTSYTFSSWMGVLTDYAGGEVHLTGYPAKANGKQVDQVGSVTADLRYSVLDYAESGFSSPGDSGGPLWLDANGSDDVAGIVSTTGYACQLTAADLSQIESWVNEDGYSLESPSTTHTAPVVTAASNVSLAEGQAIAASSLIASISNPSGDDITETLYEDAGGGSGYFTVDGVRQADSVWIHANPSQNVQYVGGSSSGSDTLNVGIYDATTDSAIYASSAIIASTTGPGQGAAGVLWRNSSTGGVELWSPNGSGGFAYHDLGTVDSSWQIAATGDFAGNSEDGILWRNTATGGVELWNQNGSAGFTYDSLGIVNPSWEIQETGDFTGSGADSILWRNTATGGVELWNPDGSGGFAYESLGVVNSNWRIEGTGDFTWTGADSILWRNASTGGVELWNSNGAAGFTYQSPGVVNPSWQIAATGDFAGGGADSILWRNASTGAAELWNPDGAGGFAYESLGVVNPTWQIFKQG
jgi:V8-like Glu-specific endopeptidase